MLLVMLGMAVGTGNIWRFPRIAATNGGGTFLIPWAIFLLAWSVPLLLVEFAMGKASRRGPVGAFATLIGGSWAWMGAWIALCATFIMFYYSVVTGWCLRYLAATVTGEIPASEPGALWESYAGSGWAVLTMAISLGLGVWVVAGGIRWIEKAARVMMPTLLVLVVILAIRAVTLPGAERGLAFLFTPDFSALGNSRVWLEALTQNAWDTGAGWGLALTYATYMRAREDTTVNAFVLGFGNNSISLLAGIMVLCTVFSIMPDAAAQITGAGNEGLTFIWVPQLFETMVGGRFFMLIFFAALFFAAWTSTISMVELVTRTLQDLGMPRRRALGLISVLALLLGIPSALNRSMFLNQDFVWGVGLMVSGLFFALAVLKFGVTRFRETLVNGSHSDIRIGAWWDWAIRLVVVQAAVLVVWWLWQVRADVWGPEGPGPTLVQWAVALTAFLLLNNTLVRLINAHVDREVEPDTQPIVSIP